MISNRSDPSHSLKAKGRLLGPTVTELASIRTADSEKPLPNASQITGGQYPTYSTPVTHGLSPGTLRQRRMPRNWPQRLQLYLGQPQLLSTPATPAHTATLATTAPGHLETGHFETAETNV
uniref:Movement protein n=1 Tax=Caenorhabditis tropicalis TaxID=1561998 RepID=A0A1I7V3F2_9PELO